MKKYLITFILIIFISVVPFFNGCSDETVSSGSNSIFYFEQFDQPFDEMPYTSVNESSYFKSIGSGWNIYLEDIYELYDPDTTFNWYQMKDTVSNSYYLRGWTSEVGMGELWLYKSFSISSDDSIFISVNGRTAKIHNGAVTGPLLYVFDGVIKYPSHSLEQLNDWIISRWYDSSISPWMSLNLKIKPNSTFMTIALKVHDAWDSYPIFCDFSNLIITSF